MKSKSNPEKESPRCPQCGATLVIYGCYDESVAIHCSGCNYMWDEIDDGELWRQ